MLKGYLSTQYTNIYSHLGEIVPLEHSEGSLLLRKINDQDCDLSNIYPFLTYNKGIPAYDLQNAIHEYNPVTVTIVTDPLKPLVSSLPAEDYKEHAVVELDKYNFNNLSDNVKRNIKTAKSDLEINMRILDPLHHPLHKMYQNLVKRHNITSELTNYTLEQMEGILDVPGAVSFTAKEDPKGDRNWIPKIVNRSVFYIQGDDAYYVLGCQSDEGYSLKSNFLLMHEAIETFKKLGLNRLLLGSAPEGNEGLKRFKKGFSTQMVTNQIIKLVCNEEKYASMVDGRNNDNFPAYRFNM